MKRSHLDRLTARVQLLTARAVLGRLHGVSVEMKPDRMLRFDTASELLTFHVRLMDSLHAAKHVEATLDDWMAATRNYHAPGNGDGFYYLDMSRERWHDVLAEAMRLPDETKYYPSLSAVPTVPTRQEAADKALGEALDELGRALHLTGAGVR